jgi:hypothetical protein
MSGLSIMMLILAGIFILLVVMMAYKRFFKTEHDKRLFALGKYYGEHPLATIVPDYIHGAETLQIADAAAYTIIERSVTPNTYDFYALGTTFTLFVILSIVAIFKHDA